MMNEMVVGDLHVWWKRIRRLTVEMDEKVEIDDVRMDGKVEINGEEIDWKVEINLEGGDNR